MVGSSGWGGGMQWQVFASLRSPLVWSLVALTVAAAFVARNGIAQLTAVPRRILAVAGTA